MIQSLNFAADWYLTRDFMHSRIRQDPFHPELTFLLGLIKVIVHEVIVIISQSKVPHDVAQQ